MRPDVAAYLSRRSEVPGWFTLDDFLLFDWLLAGQGKGDLAEIGAYYGASAILLGLHLRGDEVLTVCDLFGLSTATDNQAENEVYYQGLTLEQFERHYGLFVAEPPVIVRASSLVLRERVTPRTCRFVHVDGCHLYDYVRADIESAREILNDEGIISCDDWRTFHTPGVTAAIFDAVLTNELHPIAITKTKFYGSWNASLAADIRRSMPEYAAATPDVVVDVQSIRGIEWPRLWIQPKPRAPSLRERVMWKVRHRS